MNVNDDGISISDEVAALICPACGYDLRATVSGRCGECGLEIDRLALQVSGIPWAHRGRMGAFKAYFRTLWQFTLDRISIRYEAAKPQELADARQFCRVNAWIVAVALNLALGAAIYAHDGLDFLGVTRSGSFLRTRMANWSQPSPNWLFDLAIPWSAGATMLPVAAGSLILAGFWLTGAARFVFHARGLSPQRRERVFCLAHYATAPLAMLLPGILFAVAASFLRKPYRDSQGDAVFGAAIGVALLGAGIAGVVALGGSLLRTAQWFRRTRHCGVGRGVLAGGELFFLWLLGLIVLVGFLPWCLGFLWIVVDSLR